MNYAPVPPSPARASAWSIVTAVGAALSGAGIVTFGILGWRAHEADVSRQQADALAFKAAVEDVSAAVRSTTAVTWVHVKDTVHDCFGHNQTFECSVTNTDDEPIEACFRGVLSQKNGGGTMRSFTLCTGRVPPRETRTVVVPWERGSAEDICNKAAFGTRVLDWTACEFDVQPVDPPAAASPAAPAAPAASVAPATARRAL